MRGAIGNLDVAQIVLYAFWLFFFGLLFYLRREDRREGYPLESATEPGFKARDVIWIPKPKTFRRSDGREVSVPNFRADTRPVNATKTESWPGAPLQPNGDPMLAGVGPGSYAERADETYKTADGHDLIVPLRVATNYAVPADSVSPIGFAAWGADRAQAGIVRDLWVDRAECMLRYYEIETRRRQACPPAGKLLERRHEASPHRRQRLAGQAVRGSAGATQPRQGHPARGRQDYGLLRRRDTLCDRGACGAPAMKAVNLEKLLPHDIPAGERILWHGRPQWISLARRAYRADFVIGYFAALTVWNVYSAAGDSGWGAAALVAAKTLGIGAAALALLALLSYLSARTTLYVVTSRRVVMKIGVALPIFINIPFKQIVSASTCAYGDGTGDIPVRVTSNARMGYLVLWPHARPFHFANPEPALRSVANVAAVAEALSRALREANGQPEGAISRDDHGPGGLARSRRRASQTSDGVRR